MKRVQPARNNNRYRTGSMEPRDELLTDPADRGIPQNAVQGNVAQGGAAQNGAVQNGAAQEIPACTQCHGTEPQRGTVRWRTGWRADPSAPTWRYEVNTPEEFQKFVQLSSQGADGSTRRTRPPPCRCLEGVARRLRCR